MKSTSLIDLALVRIGVREEVADGFADELVEAAKAVRKSPVKKLRAMARVFLEPMPKDWKP